MDVAAAAVAAGDDGACWDGSSAGGAAPSPDGPLHPGVDDAFAVVGDANSDDASSGVREAVADAIQQALEVRCRLAAVTRGYRCSLLCAAAVSRQDAEIVHLL